MKTLMWLAFIGLVIAALFKKSATKKPTQINQQDISIETPAHSGAENMVNCQLCGLYFPASEAITKHRAVFCSEDHAQRFTPS